MSDLVCRRCGNAMEWRTHPTRSGGFDACWQCEQRTARGQPLLPVRVETPIEMLRKIATDHKKAPTRKQYLVVSAERYAELVEGKEEALTEKLRRRDRLRKKGAVARLLNEHAAKRNLAHWQAKADQFALGLTG